MTTKKVSGNLLTRRETLRLVGAAGAAAFVGWGNERAMRLLPAGPITPIVKASALSCVVRPQQTEGPYFVDEKLNRSDIRIDPTSNSVKAGLPLRLKINVSRVDVSESCSPLPGAYVDIWQCDAAGVYSDVRDQGGLFDTRGQKFLRGYQVTDQNGEVEFMTIYPGWYTGRTVHIHFKIRLSAGSQSGYEFTSQLYFDDSVTDQVHAQAPYSAKGTRNTRNNRDGIFNNNGNQLMLSLTQDGQGYLGTFDIGLQGVVLNEPPEITGAAVEGRKLIVTGKNIGAGARILLNGERQKKTGNDELNPSTVLIARKSGKKILPGQTVTIQVRNPDDKLSNDLLFTRPV